MNISLLCSDTAHPVNSHLRDWIERRGREHQIELVRKASELGGGDILFLVSCSEIIPIQVRASYRACLVLHASDLPKGRGWSPHIWEVAAGASHVTLSLLEANDDFDSGRIWKKTRVEVPSTALWDEINHLLFTAEVDLMDFAVSALDSIEPQVQAPDVPPTYYRRRTPDDSRIDPARSIEEQFDLVRVCDPDRFPAFFELRGQRYRIRIEKVNHE